MGYMSKVFKSGPSKICGRQPVRNFTWSILEYFVPYMSAEQVNTTYLKL